MRADAREKTRQAVTNRLKVEIEKHYAELDAAASKSGATALCASWVRRARNGVRRGEGVRTVQGPRMVGCIWLFSVACLGRRVGGVSWIIQNDTCSSTYVCDFTNFAGVR